jgi:hypothetical protein
MEPDFKMTIVRRLLMLGLLIVTGCIHSGSAFDEYTLSFQDEREMKQKGVLLIDELIFFCSQRDFRPQQKIIYDAKEDDAFVRLRSKGEREPIIWITIYRSRRHDVTVAVSSLESVSETPELIRLKNDIAEKMRVFASMQGLQLKGEGFNSSVLH